MRLLELPSVNTAEKTMGREKCLRGGGVIARREGVMSNTAVEGKNVSIPTINSVLVHSKTPK